MGGKSICVGPSLSSHTSSPKSLVAFVVRWTTKTGVLGRGQPGELVQLGRNFDPSTANVQEAYKKNDC
jgi:hypothetical protein